MHTTTPDTKEPKASPLLTITVKLPMGDRTLRESTEVNLRDFLLGTPAFGQAIHMLKTELSVKAMTKEDHTEGEANTSE